MVQTRLWRIVGVGCVSAMAALLVGSSWIWPSWYLASWVGLAVLWGVASANRPSHAWIWGGLAGAGALALAFQWIPEAVMESLDFARPTAWCVFAASIAYEAIPFGITAFLVSRTLARSAASLWAISAIWVAFELYWPKAFFWSMAHTQTEFLPVLQIAELFGAPGVSFVITSSALAPAVLVAQARLPRPERRWRPAITQAVLAMLVLMGTLVFGHHQLDVWQRAPLPRQRLRVAIVQVDPSYGDSIAKMRAKSLALDEQVQLICWPESTLGNYSTMLADFSDEGNTLKCSLPPVVDLQPTRGIHCHVLAGGRLFLPGATDDGPFYQTGFLLRPGQSIAGRYLKRTLMPIGEYIPGEQWLPWLRRAAGLQDIASTGDQASPLRLPGDVLVGVFMCYDDMVPANARRTVAEGAHVLVTLANGSAFKNPLVLEQHLRLSLLRAVENRRCFARCAATGVSCVVAPTGAVTDRIDTNVESIMLADLPIIDTRTLYNRVGFLFAPACLVASLVWLCGPLWRSLGSVRHRVGVWRSHSRREAAEAAEA